MKRTTYVYIEGGRSMPGLRSLVKIAAAFGAGLHDLVDVRPEARFHVNRWSKPKLGRKPKVRARAAKDVQLAGKAERDGSTHQRAKLRK